MIRRRAYREKGRLLIACDEIRHLFQTGMLDWKGPGTAIFIYKRCSRTRRACLSNQLTGPFQSSMLDRNTCRTDDSRDHYLDLH